MPNYYLDIETTGLDPRKDKIITIQFMRLNSATAEPEGELVILKEWDSSEGDILKEFINRSQITGSSDFAFVPVGFNLGFEHNFLMDRCRYHKLPIVDILSKPFIDLKSMAVIMNGGSFAGSSLDNLTGKPHSGKIIPVWYAERRYGDIEEYIRKEAEEFVKLCKWLYKELPKTLKNFKGINNLD